MKKNKDEEIYESSRRRESVPEKLLKEIIAPKFPNLGKEIDS